MPDRHPFLSDAWFAAAAPILASVDDAVPTEVELAVNVEVTDSPFGTREFHAGSTDGHTTLALGSVGGADLTLATDYETARDVFVSGDPGAAMQAFLAGKVRIQGDLTKLVDAITAGGGPGSPAVASALQSITE